MGLELQEEKCWISLGRVVHMLCDPSGKDRIGRLAFTGVGGGVSGIHQLVV